MIPLEEILEALDLSRAQPGSGFLEALFARFVAKVPFESASKIVRDAEVPDLSDKPRTPEVFWADHLERGAGGTCFARVAAFDALLSRLGFSTRRVLGRVSEPFDHASLLVETADGEKIADVGFPLPSLLPARAGSDETAVGALRVEPSALGFRVAFESGVPEGPRSLEIGSAVVSDAEFLERWRGTFASGARFLREVSVRRDLADRSLSYAGGEVRVDDLHSRLRVPLREKRAAALAGLFGMDEALLSRAFAIAGDPAPASPEATLTAYLEVETPPDRAFAAISSPEGYRKLLEGVAVVVDLQASASGFRLTLSAGDTDAPSLEEEVTLEPSARRVNVLRRSGAASQRLAYVVAQPEGRGTHLLREATLSGAREDLLRNDSLRGRLAGTLAVDLLGWARML